MGAPKQRKSGVGIQKPGKGPTGTPPLVQDVTQCDISPRVAAVCCTAPLLPANRNSHRKETGEGPEDHRKDISAESRFIWRLYRTNQTVNRRAAVEGSRILRARMHAVRKNITSGASWVIKDHSAAKLIEKGQAREARPPQKGAAASQGITDW